MARFEGELLILQEKYGGGPIPSVELDSLYGARADAELEDYTFLLLFLHSAENYLVPISAALFVYWLLLCGRPTDILPFVLFSTGAIFLLRGLWYVPTTFGIVAVFGAVIGWVLRRERRYYK